jgi:5'-deoxynucleotidase YfbR-like HD superfamily hydrolase
MTERKGGWVQTYTGRQFWPADPRPEDVRIEDIAHSLSNQCRFGGHVKRFYSVAEHSVHVARYLEWRGLPDGTKPKLLALYGLLHDASEAYVVDVPRPVKYMLQPAYGDMEFVVLTAIHKAFGLPELWPTPFVGCIAAADEILLLTEKRDLMAAEPASWGPALEKPLELLDLKRPMSPDDAFVSFMTLFKRLRDSAECHAFIPGDPACGWGRQCAFPMSTGLNQCGYPPEKHGMQT